MARKAQLKTVYRKSKIVVTLRGKKIYEFTGNRRHEEKDAFLQGWHRSSLLPQHDTHVWAHMSHLIKSNP
jgi:hypothetical protein